MYAQVQTFNSPVCFILMKLAPFILFMIFQASLPVKGQSYKEIDRDQLMALIGEINDTTYVVNFWATWCSPCVKEIGYFNDIYRNSGEEKLQVLLISLDFPNQAENRIPPFLKEKDITAPVFLMTDLKYNEWIDQVDPSWSGAIPATLIFRNDRRIFLEKELTREELLENVNQILN